MTCDQYILNYIPAVTMFGTVISLFMAHRWFCVWALYWVIIAECTIINNT